MANIAESGQRSSFSPFSATVAELKAFLAENDLPTTGRKQELQERAVNILETEDLLYRVEWGNLGYGVIWEFFCKQSAFYEE